MICAHVYYVMFPGTRGQWIEMYFNMLKYCYECTSVSRAKYVDKNTLVGIQEFFEEKHSSVKMALFH